MEPSYSMLLENPFHKSPRRARQVVELFNYEKENDDAKISKFPIWVNRKIAEIVPHS
jgi:hypothetical protein